MYESEESIEIDLDESELSKSPPFSITIGKRNASKDESREDLKNKMDEDLESATHNCNESSSDISDISAFLEERQQAQKTLKFTVENESYSKRSTNDHEDNIEIEFEDTLEIKLSEDSNNAVDEDIEIDFEEDRVNPQNTNETMVTIDEDDEAVEIEFEEDRPIETTGEQVANNASLKVQQPTSGEPIVEMNSYVIQNVKSHNELVFLSPVTNPANTDVEATSVYSSDFENDDFDDYDRESDQFFEIEQDEETIVDSNDRQESMNKQRDIVSKRNSVKEAASTWRGTQLGGNVDARRGKLMNEQRMSDENESMKTYVEPNLVDDAQVAVMALALRQVVDSIRRSKQVLQDELSRSRQYHYITLEEIQADIAARRPRVRTWAQALRDVDKQMMI